MTTTRSLQLLAGAVLILVLATSAVATPTVIITGVGTRDGDGVLQLGTNVNLGNNRAVLITGYVADIETKDVGRSGRVILESTADLSLWSIPIVNRLWGAKLAVRATTSGRLDAATATALSEAGFLAAADSYSLPAGSYSVKSVTIIFGANTVMTLPVTETMSLTVPENRTTSSLTLADPAGAPVAFTPKVMPNTDDVRLSNYPPQKSGNYKLTSLAFDKWGRSGGAPTEFTLGYTRPLVDVEVSNPLAEGFEGFPQRFSLANPLTGIRLSGAITGEATIDAASPSLPDNALINGVPIVGAGKVTVSLDELIGSTTAGVGGSQYSARVATSGEGGLLRVFLNLPDAPDLRFMVSNWNPDKGIAVAPTKPAFAVGVEPAIISVARIVGSKCGTVYEAAAVGVKFGVDMVYCAVRWITLPDGMIGATPSANLTGRLTAVGPASGSYETGVLWTHPVTKEVTFSRSAARTVNVDAQAPAAPAILFIPDSLLVRAGAINPLAYAGNSMPGSLRINAHYAGLGVRIINDSGDTITASSATAQYSRAITLENAVVGVQRTVNVEVFYNAAPDVVYPKTLTFDVVPRRQILSLVSVPVAVSTTPLVLSGTFGSPQADGSYVYDPDTQGHWSVQFSVVDNRGTLTPVGDPITEIPVDGSFSLNAGLLTPGLRSFTAVATQIDAAAGTTVTLRGRNVAVNVRDGSEIAMSVTTLPALASGPSPFSPLIRLQPVLKSRFLDIGLVSYELSDDGVTFAPILQADGAPMAGTMMLVTSQTLTGNTTKFVRATVKNRWSDIQTATAPTQVQSFTVPTLLLRSPRYSFIQFPITVTSDVGDTDPASLAYKWTVRQGAYDRTPVITEGGTTLALTPTAAMPALLVELEIKDALAPANPRAIRRASVSIAVLLPTLVRPSVTGPIIVETGKSYTWTALQRSPFPAGTVTDIVVNSRWVLPDGTFSTDNPVTYVYKEGDVAKVRYESWVDGYPTSNVGTDFTLRPWTYTWPAMKMLTSVLNPYAPSRVQFLATLVTPTQLAGLHGEVLSYEWTLPAAAILISQKDGTLIAEFPEAGTYATSVTVSDTRGNSTKVDSPSFVVLPPKPMTFSFTLTSADRWNRPPGPVLARVAATSMPTGDVMKSVTFFVDGVQVGTEVASGANLSLPDPGTYSIKALIRTVKGVTADATQTITMALGDAPACKITKNGDGVSVLWFSTVCTVARGRVASYRWKVNGQDTQVTATIFRQAVAYIAGTTSVEVTATTDGGQVGGAVFTMSTGVSTATP